MRIAVYTYLTNVIAYNAFVTSFKLVNTLHDYTFILAYSGNKPNSLADVEISLELNSSAYMQNIHNLINSDYDFIIFSNDSIYCNRSIDGIISNLEAPNSLSVYCSAYPFEYSNENNDTGGLFLPRENINAVINYSFFIVNCCNFDFMSVYQEFSNLEINSTFETIISHGCNYICIDKKFALGTIPCHDKINEYYNVDMNINVLLRDNSFISFTFYFLNDYKEILDSLNYSVENINSEISKNNTNSYLNLFYIEYYKWYNFEGENVIFE